jgi:hypothetical protein
MVILARSYPFSSDHTIAAGIHSNASTNASGTCVHAGCCHSNQVRFGGGSSSASTGRSLAANARR